MAGAGWDVVLIGIKDDETPEFEKRDGYVVKRVTLSSRRLPRGFGLKFIRFAEAIVRTFSAALREHADVYNSRDAYPLLVCWMAARLRGAKLVYDSDELNLDRNWSVSSNPWWRGAMKRYEGALARRSSLVITSDFGRAEVLTERYGIDPVVVRNVPDLVEALDPDQQFRARAVGDRRYLLIYQGILVPNRGLSELVDAMRELPECRLAIVGYGQLAKSLRDQVERDNMSDAVELFDPVPYEVLARYTAAADVGLIPIHGTCLSYALAAPNKLFEYMMAGIPIVASDLPEMAAVITAEQIGTLITDPSDPASIADAVMRLLDGDESPAEIGARARRAALDRYNWGIEQQKLLDAYGTLGLAASGL
jgi:glycosyltransferase involved in cell wall biosynthesis